MNQLHYQQPITLIKVPSSRVPSLEASRKTVKRRVEVLDTVKKGSSGNNSTFGYSRGELIDTRTAKKALQQTQLPLVISADHALALKANLSNSWTRFRVFQWVNQNVNISLKLFL